MNNETVDKILLPVPLAKTNKREKTVRREFWSKFRSYASALPFAEDVAAGYYCATDRNTPFKVRATLLAALAYFIMPLDMVPDILAMVGFTDDIAVLSAAIAMVQNHVTDEHRTKARAAMENIDVNTQ